MQNNLRVLAIGDIIDEQGQAVIYQKLPTLRKDLKIDFIVANGENAAGGKGITTKIAAKLFEASVDVITTGNHFFDQREILTYVENESRLLRPANFLPGVPGKGVWIGEIQGVQIAVLNLIGQVYMGFTFNSPFWQIDQELEQLKNKASIILIDFHAEATSEKNAFGRYLDGRASLVFGTHSHIPTADERIFPQGTAFVTDVGMTGPYESVIGMRIDLALKKYSHGIPQKYQSATEDVQLNALLVEIDRDTGKAQSVKRIREKLS